MVIDRDNYTEGNKAMASVLLLYYQVITGGGIFADETVYVDPEDFEGFNYLDVKVKDGNELEISEKLLREGAVVYLLCDLNDMVSEFDEDYLDQILTQKIISAFENGLLSAVNGADNLVKLVRDSNYQLDYDKYRDLLDSIYEKYVVGNFRQLISKNT
jgi:hypothetical protein